MTTCQLYLVLLGYLAAFSTGMSIKQLLINFRIKKLYKKIPFSATATTNERLIRIGILHCIGYILGSKDEIPKL